MTINKGWLNSDTSIYSPDSIRGPFVIWETKKKLDQNYEKIISLFSWEKRSSASIPNSPGVLGSRGGSCSLCLRVQPPVNTGSLPCPASCRSYYLSLLCSLCADVPHRPVSLLSTNNIHTTSPVPYTVTAIWECREGEATVGGGARHPTATQYNIAAS